MAKVKQEIEFVVNGSGNAPKFMQEVSKDVLTMSSGLKSIKTLVGLAGLSEVVSKFAAMTNKAVEMKQAFDEGAVSAGKMTEEILKMIPGIGKIWEIGRNIRELAWGADEATQLERAQKAQDKLIASTREYLDLRKQLGRGIEDLDAKYRNERPNSLSAILRGGGRALEDVNQDPRIKASLERQAELAKEIAVLEEKSKSLRWQFRDSSGRMTEKTLPGYEEATSQLRLKQGQKSDLDKDTRAFREKLERDVQRAMELEIIKAGGAPVIKAIQGAFESFVGRAMREMAEGQAREKGLKGLGKMLGGALGVPGDLLGGVAGAAGGWLSGLGNFGTWQRNLNPAQFSGGLAPSAQSSFLTGVGEAGRENDPNVKTAKNTATTNKILGDVLHFWQQNWAKFGGFPVFNG